jgi:4-alpha-glucanotransferase
VNPVSALARLARLYGVETSYFDILAQRRHFSNPEVLLAVLRALGAPLEKIEDAGAAARARRLELWRRAVEPVAVAWQHVPATLKLRLPAGDSHGRLRCRLELEDGREKTWTHQLENLPAAQVADIEGMRFLTRILPLPSSLPPGYHRLHLERGRQRFETLVIAAPRTAWTPAEAGLGRAWGVFLPLYALRSLGSWGTGDFTDLEALQRWTGELGGRLVGTLPLLPAMLDEPFEPSPYAPASRLFWNEFYVDVTRAPELKRAPAAQRLLGSESLRAALEDLRAEPLVDYRRTLTLKREVLRELARAFFAAPGRRGRAFQAFLRARPEVEDYARFRAAADERGAGCPDWPAPLRDGIVGDGDFEEEAQRYHLYAQWLAEEQLLALAHKSRGRKPGLYLDLPVGTHPAGYDVWRERAAFALGLAAGAPPDSLFIQGQNWGFPPLHPERLRAQGYRYFIACLRHHLRPASVLRIDHVMSLHHLFVIPPGVPAHEGTYIRYAAEEMYAIVALESRRAKTVVVGEDLGTVPFYVRPALARHRLQRSYILPFEMNPSGDLHTPAPETLASLNTHDMRPFHGFWRGLDLDDRVELRLLEAREVETERAGREWFRQALAAFLEKRGWVESGHTELEANLRACLRFLAASPAGLVLVNLEDLWLETEAQNTPGTVAERPNWRRKARYSLEAFCQMPAVLDTLHEVNQRRRGRTKR